MKSLRIQTGIHHGLTNHHGATKAHEIHRQSSGKLHVVVQLEPGKPAACLIVRGHVTEQSLQAIYILARRINVAVPGADISVDLALARTTGDALARLEQVSEAGFLPVTADPSGVPCHLRILHDKQQMA
ncbi:hypothetical protein [Arthrobacter sp. NyZ413]|uniref:hypothetical protein n=1 Tax=Arthrobacter sp. NyZ413 TaxID=3144669 RepID=UPI003BF7838A